MLQCLEVKRLKGRGIVEGFAQGIGQVRVLVENRKVQLIGPPVPIGRAARGFERADMGGGVAAVVAAVVGNRTLIFTAHE